ncbi:S49 family peptidase [Desulfovibrio oxyclinae]|uniref:S49 family peptidase n=1 Tax=Desulfovibrio oxyclinae TaxID=63560 RepID=UPI00035CF881|nr:S49 family peptidase [Desulfovibrio oxyclinae]
MQPDPTDLFGSSWAITEDALAGVLHAVRDKETASLVFPGSDAETVPYKVDGGVAVIPVTGSLSRRSWFRQSYSGIRKSVSAALGDDSVHAILLDTDSPGGTVAGVYELGEYLREANAVKPIYSLANSQMTSAAYWVGSAGGRVYASAPTASVGSIGVLRLHMDWSKFNDKVGITPTWLHAGAYKALGNPDEPLSQKARDCMQASLDGNYRLFVETVAQNMGLAPEKANDWADGQVFRAEDALGLGLVKGIMPKEQLIKLIKEETMSKTAKELRAEYPEAVREIVASVSQDEQAKVRKELDEAVTKAATDSTERVMSIVEALLDEKASARIKACVEAGLTAEQVTALGVIPQKDGPQQNGEDPAKQDADTQQPEDSRASILQGLHAAMQDNVDPGGARADNAEAAREAGIDRMVKHATR